LFDLEFLELQVDALFTHDERGRLCYVNEPDGNRAPHFFFGRSKGGNVWRCRDDLPEEVVRRLEKLASVEPVDVNLRSEPQNLHAFNEALGAAKGAAKGVRQFIGPAYRFPAALPSTSTTATSLKRTELNLLRRMNWNIEQAARHFERYAPFIVVIEDGFAVSLCHSARLTHRAAEAGVATLEAYRGRGYAAVVVTAWAHAIRATGRVPLYSTSWDNLASQGVARRLRLVHYGTDLSLG
jgi:hypothetical protein